jgi:hypothetical protein
MPTRRSKKGQFKMTNLPHHILAVNQTSMCWPMKMPFLTNVLKYPIMKMGIMVSIQKMKQGIRWIPGAAQRVLDTSTKFCLY